MVLTKNDIDLLDRTLFEIIKKAEARCALLVLQDGRPLAHRGQTEGIDLDALCALIAGSFATTREIARLLGEPEFTVMFHQGESEHIHNLLVDADTILTVVFDDRTTIGMTRLYAKEAKPILAETLARARDRATREETTESDDDDDLENITQERYDSVFGGGEETPGGQG